MPLLLACASAPSAGWALNLTQNAQLGVSRSSPTGERWTIWARRSDGLLVSRRDDPSTGFVWDAHSAQGIPGPTSQGVTATSWFEGGVYEQRAYYVAADLLTAVKPGTVPWQDTWWQFAPPVGKTPTGRIAATWAWENGVLYRWVFATMTSGDLYVLRIEPAPNEHVGTWQLLEAGVSTTAPIAASNSPTGDYARVFARKGDTVWMERHTFTGAWTGNNLGQPGTGIAVCGTMAAAEGTINTSYRIYLFCTKANGTNDKLYVASGIGVTDNVFDWITRSTPNNEQVRNSGYALAATRRLDGAAYAIDAYLLTTNSNLYYVKHTQTSGLITQIADGALGLDGESTSRLGGMAAVPSGRTSPSGQGYSYGHYVGLGVSAYRLYRRVGEVSIHFAADDPESWGEYHETTGEFLHTMQVIAGVPPDAQNGASSGLFSQWVSPGFYYWSQP